jgi:transcriptional regulator with XRE-family HTH domain
MPQDEDSTETIGQRIRRFRMEGNMTASQLAEKAGISKSYLSELESGTGTGQNPSAPRLYDIAKALGVAMSDLLGRPIITEPRNERPASLLEFAEKNDLPDADVEMLAAIEFRGEQPRTPERWAFIYQAIKNSVAMDG